MVVTPLLIFAAVMEFLYLDQGISSDDHHSVIAGVFIKMYQLPRAEVGVTVAFRSMHMQFVFVHFQNLLDVQDREIPEKDNYIAII